MLLYYMGVGAFPDGLVAEKSTRHAGNTGIIDSIPGSARSTAGGNGNPLPYSCRKSPMDKRSLAGYIVHRVAKTQK